MKIKHTPPPACDDGYFDEDEGVVVNATTCNDPKNCALHPEHSAANDRP